jgi:hypothetical protein
MFAPVGDGQRRRRGTDGARLAGAIVALVCCVIVIRYNSRIDRAIIGVIHPPPRSITWLVTVVYDAGAFGVTIGLLLLALVARRWVIARDIALSATGAAVVSGILTLVLGSTGGRPSGIAIHGYYVRFPVLQIAVFMAVATAALPYLARGVQRLIEIFIALVALASAVGGHGLPVNVLGSLAIGWGATALSGTSSGSPPVSRSWDATVASPPTTAARSSWPGCGSTGSACARPPGWELWARGMTTWRPGCCSNWSAKRSASSGSASMRARRFRRW